MLMLAPINVWIELQKTAFLSNMRGKKDTKNNMQQLLSISVLSTKP